jgi:hypothetical protein
MIFGYLLAIGTVGTGCSTPRIGSHGHVGKYKQMPQRGLTGPVPRRSVILGYHVHRLFCIQPESYTLRPNGGCDSMSVAIIHKFTTPID